MTSAHHPVPDRAPDKKSKADRRGMAPWLCLAGAVLLFCSACGEMYLVHNPWEESEYWDDSGDGGDDSGDGGDDSGGSDPVRMITVPAGPFWRGCNSSVDTECEPDENPYRQITLSAFEIDETEVTQAAYASCVNAGECGTPSCDWSPSSTGNHPVVCVNWESARSYCQWAGKRLPTEAEWEKAARGTDGRKFPWGNEEADCSRANIGGCGGATKPVGSTPSGNSPYGAKDMAGNVWEWVSDWYASGYYTNAPDSDPQGPSSGSDRVKRGGGWRTGASYARASSRYFIYPGYESVSLGFRCARSVP